MNQANVLLTLNSCFTIKTTKSRFIPNCF